jgi:esterase/lipase superfamily enzyme
MITNRNKEPNRLGDELSTPTYWVSDAGPLDTLSNWTELSATDFQSALVAAADQFPLILDPGKQEDQKHVCIFVHGYNNSWEGAAQRYKSLNARLFEGEQGLGVCILFSWPSEGSPLGYYPDRIHARKCAPDLSEVLNKFYDWLLGKQDAAVADPRNACRAKTSMIAHSMGNYLLEKAMQDTWTRKNQPLLVTLINQLLMVAADVDNDLFKSGEGIDKSDGDAIANLTYRVTALYTGRDPFLGVSAGLKHFGKRRLGRSGLDRSYPVPDNVWDVDCSTLITSDATNIHSSYFEEDKTIELMRQVLRGIDRKVLVAQGIAPQPALGMTNGVPG